MSVFQVSIFLIVVVAAFIGIDVYLAVDSRGGNTYSEIITAFSKRHVWFPLVMCFGFGLLAGHWWWT